MAKKKKKNLRTGVKALLTLSASSGQCADPDCNQPLIIFDKGIPVVNFEYGHIRDELKPANQEDDIGWRFWPEENMTQNERNQASNIILICSTTHKIIDKIDPRSYSVELLHEWKNESETDFSFENYGVLTPSDRSEFDDKLDQITKNQRVIINEVRGNERPSPFSLSEASLNQQILEMLISDDESTSHLVEQLLSDDDENLEEATGVLEERLLSLTGVAQKIQEQKNRCRKRIATINFYKNPQLGLAKLDELLAESPSDVQALSLYGNLCIRVGDYQKAKRSFDEILKIGNLNSDPHLVAQALGNLGVCSWSKGDNNTALKYFIQSAEKFDSVGAELDAAAQTMHIGLIHHIQGNHQEAFDHYSKARTVFETLGSPAGLCRLYVNLANLARVRGDHRSALELYDLALRFEDNEFEQSSTLMNKGNVYKDQGDNSKAEEFYLRSLKIGEKSHNEIGQAFNLGNLGEIYLDRDDLPAAEDYIQRSYNIFERLEHKLGMSNQHGNLGLLLRRRKDYLRAQRHYEASLKLNREMGRPEGIANQLGNIAIIYLDQDSLDKAIKSASEALEIDKSLNRLIGIAVQSGTLGEAYYKKAAGGGISPDLPLQYFKQALTANLALKRVPGIVKANINLGRIYLSLKEADKAKEHLVKAISIAESNNRLDLAQMAQALLDSDLDRNQE